MTLDTEQGNDEVYNYDFYEIKTIFEEYEEEQNAYEIIDEECSTYYYAIKKEEK